MQHVPLVEVTRGGLVESIHSGSLVAVSSRGAELLAAGDPDALVYARSALKPLQAVAMVRAGLDLPPELLALAAASHSGSPAHLAGAERILAAHGADASDLRNVPGLPGGDAERDAYLRAGGMPTPLAHTCSGKHAAMVATCRVAGWDPDDYLDPGHPLQQLVVSTIAELTGEEPGPATTDGCGTPLVATTLRGFARAYARLTSAAEGTPERRVADAMRAHPEMVAGEGRDVTALMRAAPGLLAKDGAEAVQALALPDGTGIAIKIADGGDRARLPIALAVLERLGVAVDGVMPPAVLGGGRAVGVLRAGTLP